MRIPRIYIKHTATAYYHIFTHLQPEAPWLTPQEKHYLLQLLRRLSAVFFIRTISYAILDNHFHLLVKVLPQQAVSEADALRAALLLYPPTTVYSRPGAYWRARLRDISFFLKELKQRLSQRYNRLRGRRGGVWEGRFKAVVVEDGRAAAAASVYVDLNPVRAGLARRVDGYYFSSYAARTAGGGGWLLPLEEIGLSEGRYGFLLEQVGKVEKEGFGRVEEGERALLVHLLSYRAEGLVYGSEEFVRRVIRGFPLRRRVKAKVGGFALA